MMEYEIISTGSKGNAVLLGGKVLIDCGVPYAKVKPYVDRLALVLITHTHGDHLNPGTARRLARERPALAFGCGVDAAKVLMSVGVRNIGLMREGAIGRLGPEITVTPYDVPHDVPCLAYSVEIDGESCFYATDCKDLYGISAPGHDLYMVEANYEDGEMDERISEKLDRKEYIYEVRARAQHMSKADALQWLMANAGEAEIVLLHQHGGKHGR